MRRAAAERYSWSGSALSTPRISLVGLKLSYVRCPVGMYPVVWLVRRRGAVVGSTRGGAGWVVGEGCYTGYTPPHPLIGIARTQPIPRPLFLRPPRALQAAARPSAHPGLLALRYPPLGPYGRDFR